MPDEEKLPPAQGMQAQAGVAQAPRTKEDKLADLNKKIDDLVKEREKLLAS